MVPPLAPMLGRRVDELPEGDWVYEPKWDGFRCIAFRAGGEVDLRSRHDRPLARYFPELVGGLRELGCEGFVLDGESWFRGRPASASTTCWRACILPLRASSG